MAEFDVIIIGGGPGGYVCAIRCAQLGLKTAVVEGRETLGGTCLNVGCMPSKALLHASELYEAANTEFAGIGIEVKPKLNLGQMHKAKDDSVTALTKGIEFLFKKNKVEWVKGAARIALGMVFSISRPPWPFIRSRKVRAASSTWAAEAPSVIKCKV